MNARPSGFGSLQFLDVDVLALEIPAALVEPARSVIHQPRRVIFLDPRRDLVGLELSPTLIERNPDRDAGRVVKMIDHPLQFRLDTRARLASSARPKRFSRRVSLR